MYLTEVEMHHTAETQLIGGGWEENWHNVKMKMEKQCEARR